MNIYSVVEHFQQILNQCEDPVILTPTGECMLNENAQYSIELEDTFVLKENNCFKLPIPQPSSSSDTEVKYKINRIRVGMSLMEDYSNGYPYRDEEIFGILKSKEGLFAYYK